MTEEILAVSNANSDYASKEKNTATLPTVNRNQPQTQGSKASWSGDGPQPNKTAQGQTDYAWNGNASRPMRNNYKALSKKNYQKPKNTFQGKRSKKKMDPPQAWTQKSQKDWLPGPILRWDWLKNQEALEAKIQEGSGSGEPVSINTWMGQPWHELTKTAHALGATAEQHRSRDWLYRQMMTACWERRIPLYATGVFEAKDEGCGVLLYQEEHYRLKPQSIFTPQGLVRRYGLKNGCEVTAQIHPPAQSDSCPFALSIAKIFGLAPDDNAARPADPLEELVPCYPLERILLETNPDVRWDNVSMRTIDLLTPIGLGQRGLIVAPPRTGKTVLLQAMANAVVKNCPQAHLIILLVDERPEEVTDFTRQVQAEVVSSTFDEPAENHVHLAETVIEKARRMVEIGRHVIILLDSITRLARAYNTLMPNSGKILSGGVEASALQRPKRFFGSARNIEGGGSLTIMGTALVETGSRMDEVVFEEFKGTGNMELHLDRALADKRIYPAINLERSGTRKEELLYHPQEMQKIYSLRRAMKGVPSPEAMEMLIERIKKSPTNAEFLMRLNR